MPVKLAVIKESRPGEDRVAIVPEVAAKLAKGGVDVVIQSGAAHRVMTGIPPVDCTKATRAAIWEKSKIPGDGSGLSTPQPMMGTSSKEPAIDWATWRAARAGAAALT